MMFLQNAALLRRKIQTEEHWLAVAQHTVALRDNATFGKLIADLRKTCVAHENALLGRSANEELGPYQQGYHRGALSVAAVFFDVISSQATERHQERLLQLRKELDTLLAGTGVSPADLEAIEQ